MTATALPETKPSTPQDVLKLLGLPSPNAMDGFMKSLDKKFQIPKLSARSSSTDVEGAKRVGSSSSSAPTTPTGLAPTTAMNLAGADPKLLTDFLTKEVPLKYPFPLNLNANYSALSNRSSPKTSAPCLDEVTIAKVSLANSNSNSNSADGPAAAAAALCNDVMRPPSAPPVNQSQILNTAEALEAAGKFHPPSSPSVSVHIVKSPVPSPRTIANSPCIDDELMDEALVGISGK